jgi:hypothetical protein
MYPLELFHEGTAEDMRGDAVGIAPSCPFASINIISFIIMKKRE